MAVSPPPMALAWQVERWAPGVYGAFVSRVLPQVTSRSQATSWWRSPSENARVGGESDSQHLLGLGLDITDPDLDGLAIRLQRAGLVAVRAARHVHVQAWPAGTARRIGLLAAVGL